MRDEVFEVTAVLGDTLLDVALVDAGGCDELRLVPDGPIVAPPPDGAPRQVRIGLVDYTIQRRPAPRRTLPFAPAERGWLGYIAASLAVHLALWRFAADAEPPVELPDLGQTDATVRVAHAVTAAGRPVEPRSAKELQGSPDRERRGGGRPFARAAGAAGGDATPARGHMRLPRDPVKRVARAEAITQARLAGVLGSVAARSDAFKRLVGEGDLSRGFDETRAQASLYGGAGDSHGGFGLAARGRGDGAGCRDGNCGIVGSGRYGTISNGRGAGDHWGGGSAGAATLRQGGMRSRLSVFPCAGPTPCAVRGDDGLDRAIVRRYIRRTLPKVAYCYERELLAHPALAGEVVVDFAITPAGTVHEVTASGMSEPVVACVAGVIGAIVFPRSSGPTLVTYPFTFRSAG